ncbi:hypothetical protein NQ314_006110 [Rhamnusium bicolor]|uniref:Uncharacterized protein n=1 Tax=Rhamnusium bicolor TaxID=1586634 RepID=A0AAV8Z978_9CUCU|nr:hypothetical protein NQ314_006110 [Rhamnusium bicolor]
MKVVLALCIVYVIGFSHCGLLPSAALVRTPSLDSAIIKSDRIGGNFAYSTVEGHAYTAVAPVVQRVAQPVAVSYTAHQVPLGYATAPLALSQPLYTQSIFGQSLFAPSLVSSPLYGGLVAQSPFLAHAPVIGQSPILGQAPVIGQAPGIAQAPVQVEAPVQSPIQAPVGPIQGIPQADPTGQGTIVDDDTVSVESA